MQKIAHIFQHDREIYAPAQPFACTFNETGNIRNYKFIAFNRNNTEIWMVGRKRILAMIGLGD